MPQRYLGDGLAIAVDALAIGILSAVLALAYWLVTGTNGEYLALVSNLLFFEGGIILVFGSLIEFFHIKETKKIRKLVFAPRQRFERLGSSPAADEDKNDDENGAGWPLIVLGATLIIFSIIVSFDYLI
jgi:hypothetical protein